LACEFFRCASLGLPRRRRSRACALSFASRRRFCLGERSCQGSFPPSVNCRPPMRRMSLLPVLRTCRKARQGRSPPGRDPSHYTARSPRGETDHARQPSPRFRTIGIPRHRWPPGFTRATGPASCWKAASTPRRRRRSPVGRRPTSACGPRPRPRSPGDPASASGGPPRPA
jgi:hypothetical protein